MERLGRLREAMVADGIAALLVTDRVNVRWLTGFAGSAGTVHVMADGPAVLVTDDRYAERAAEDAPGWTIVSDRTWGWLAEHHPAGVPLTVEADHLTWSVVRQLEDLDADRPLHPSTGIVGTLREIKDDAEIAILRRACAITSTAFDEALGWLAPGLTEAEVARRLLETMADLGADGSAFDPIVASGPNGSRPHHAPGPRTLRTGDLVTMDFGALVDGYHADMTRTVALGRPTPSLRRVHDLVGAAQQAGVEAVADGVGTQAVDAACRDLIRDAGHGEHFAHGTGHGVGLAIHETPFLGPSTPGTLRARTTVTVEPGVYVPGLGGVRIEDVVLVGADGAERLTTAPRQLIEL
ncbi:M24 family metallopeptidase [Euzebya sp.]|uniref:M24 family metallopeptidase n=1 Tax=Euzebya sp. TaxID=1971409 RepID=UPI003519BAD8